MKKLLSSFQFLALGLGGIAIFLAAIAGVFAPCGISTEIFMLSIGFLSTFVGGYAFYKELAS